MVALGNRYKHGLKLAFPSKMGQVRFPKPISGSLFTGPTGVWCSQYPPTSALSPLSLTSWVPLVSALPRWYLERFINSKQYKWKQTPVEDGQWRWATKHTLWFSSSCKLIMRLPTPTHLLNRDSETQKALQKKHFFLPPLMENLTWTEVKTSVARILLHSLWTSCFHCITMSLCQSARVPRIKSHRLET